MQGAFALPMKYVRLWRWENTWLVYSTFGMLVLPWLFTTAGIPRIGDVYSAAGWKAIGAAAVFGLGWGLGAVFCGLSIARLGIALASAIFLGLATAIGSLVPLALATSTQTTAHGVIFTAGGVAVMLVGILLCARAGILRDALAAPGVAPRKHIAGLLMAVASGFFSSCINFSFIFGHPIVEQALATGSAPAVAAYPLLAIVLSAAFLGNGGYSIYLLGRNRTWHLFKGDRRSIDWLRAALMGVLVFSGFALYGFGSAKLGVLGPSAGWSLFLATMILTSNLCGQLAGEFRGAGRRSRRLMMAGSGTLVVAIILLGLANRP